jgi:uncharacterized protein YdhG (YjbR/CyaY superfamily)
MTNPIDFNEYKSSFPKEVQEVLDLVRATIKKAAPEAEEVISYSMPAFKMNGMLVWYAAHSKHIGFYPGASGIAVFKKELSIYKGAKGSVQFPFDKPMPINLITAIVKFKVEENLHRKISKKK